MQQSKVRAFVDDRGGYFRRKVAQIFRSSVVLAMLKLCRPADHLTSRICAIFCIVFATVGSTRAENERRHVRGAVARGWRTYQQSSESERARHTNFR